MDFRDFDAPPRRPACRATVDILTAERDALREVAAACETLSAMVEAGWVHADPGSNRPFASPDTVDVRAALAAAAAALARAQGLRRARRLPADVRLDLLRDEAAGG